MKYLKVLVENISKENNTVETVYPDDKKVTILVQKGADENIKQDINKGNKKAGKMSPSSEKDDNILVHTISEECYKCEECDYRSESEMSLKKHVKTKHQCQKPESVRKCHEC